MTATMTAHSTPRSTLAGARRCCRRLSRYSCFSVASSQYKASNLNQYEKQRRYRGVTSWWSLNPRSTSNQSSESCTVLQYPSRKARRHKLTMLINPLDIIQQESTHTRQERFGQLFLSNHLRKTPSDGKNHKRKFVEHIYVNVYLWLDYVIEALFPNGFFNNRDQELQDEGRLCKTI